MVAISDSVRVLTSPLGKAWWTPLSFMMSRTDPAPQYSMTIWKAKRAKCQRKKVGVEMSSVSHGDKGYPEVGVFKVRAIVFDDIRWVALLHDRDFFDDLLEVGVYRNLKPKFELCAILSLTSFRTLPGRWIHLPVWWPISALTLCAVPCRRTHSYPRPTWTRGQTLLPVGGSEILRTVFPAPCRTKRTKSHKRDMKVDTIRTESICLTLSMDFLWLYGSQITSLPTSRARFLVEGPHF